MSCLWINLMACSSKQHYRELGIAGLRNPARSGRRRCISHAQERAVVAATMRPARKGAGKEARLCHTESGLTENRNAIMIVKS